MHLLETENGTMLLRALVALSDEAECEAFLEDLLTGREIESISQRLAVARLLMTDSRYAEVEQLTGASSATIGRVNRCIQYGSGGYRRVLEKLGEVPKEEDA